MSAPKWASLANEFMEKEFNMENKVQHTPGPWRAQRVVVDGHEDSIIVAQHNPAIARLYSLNEPVEANARLIAAAPELLEALKSIVCAQFIEDNCASQGIDLDKGTATVRDAIDWALPIIEKVKGEA